MADRFDWRIAPLVAAIVAPALYFVAVTQYSALTFPFWDHLELTHFIVRAFDGTLQLGELFAPHNHTRPFTYRAIYVANALFTQWDLRSEYVYMIAVGLATWAVHLLAVRRFVRPEGRLRAYAVAALASILAFSPVAHNNHWWSMMLQLTLTNLLMLGALVTATWKPDSWARHACAAMLAWLAAYTLTNGIFAFVVMAAVMQGSAPRLQRPDRFAAFWVVNLLVLLALYLPGLPAEPGKGRPGIVELGGFALAYLGSPLGSLLHFPFASQFDIPSSIAWNVAVGVVVLLAAVDALAGAWPGLRSRDPRAVLLYAFVGIGLISALATAWGRAAFDDLGVSNANASRYSLFSSYVLYGLLYYHASRPTASSILSRLAGAPPVAALAPVVFGIVLVISFLTYRDAIRVYRDAHGFNQTLANAYTPRGGITDFDSSVYPKPETVQKLRAELLRVGIGPYRHRSQVMGRLGSTRLAEAVPLAPGTSFTQRFQTTRPGLAALSFQVVTWGKTPSPYDVQWKVRSSDGRELAGGRFDAGALRDWSTVEIPVAVPAAEVHDFELVLSVEPGKPIETLVGIPLFHEEKTESPMLIGGPGPQRQGVLGLRARFMGS